MNLKLLEEATFRDQLHQEWSRWKQQGKKYQNSVTWWECYVRHTLRSYQNKFVTSCSSSYFNVVFNKQTHPL